jgi:predicted nucleic-acid-binding protein
VRATDTNLLVRLMVRDEPRQVVDAEEFIRPGAWVSTVVLAEATWVLGWVYSRGPGEIADSIEILIQHEHVTLQDANAVAAALALFRRKPSLGFSDCLILEIARKNGHLPLGTFDQGLGKMDGAQKL